MKNYSFKFSVLSLLLVGCTGSLKTTKSASNDTTNPSAKENPVDVFGFFRGNTFDVSCPAGMTMTEFGISNPETLELNENPFTQARKTDPVVESYKSVIEFCADFDNLKFQLVAINQLVPSIGAGISPRGHGYKVTKDVDASSFTKALEMGDWSLIDIKFENTDDPANSIWVKGWNDKSGNPYVTLNAYDSKEGITSKISSKAHDTLGQVIQKGVIVEENPTLLKTVCSVAEIKLESGLISYDFCWKGNNATGFQYTFNGLTIKDSSKSLTKPISLELNSDQLEKHLKIKLTHHGLTDGFTFVTPESSYSLEGNGTLSITYKNGNSATIKNIPCNEFHVRTCGIKTDGPRPM